MVVRTDPFPRAFESDAPQPIQLGRLMIGPHIGRLMLFPDGQTRIALDASAKTDGSILWSPGIEEGTVFGFEFAGNVS